MIQVTWPCLSSFQDRSSLKIKKHLHTRTVLTNDQSVRFTKFFIDQEKEFTDLNESYTSVNVHALSVWKLGQCCCKMEMKIKPQKEHLFELLQTFFLLIFKPGKSNIFWKCKEEKIE